MFKTITIRVSKFSQTSQIFIFHTGKKLHQKGKTELGSSFGIQTQTHKASRNISILWSQKTSELQELNGTDLVSGGERYFRFSVGFFGISKKAIFDVISMGFVHFRPIIVRETLVPPHKTHFSSLPPSSTKSCLRNSLIAP